MMAGPDTKKDQKVTERGSFIVIEGVDGSGKSYQLHRLAKQLTTDGHRVVTLDFPRYDQPASYFARQYLQGSYGERHDVGPYTASLFYALDRFDAAKTIHQALDQGAIVLSNRFTASSMAHQGTKFVHAEERRGYFIWLDNLEFEMLKIPRPDINIVLRPPHNPADNATVSAEASLLVSVYDDLCQLFPKDFSRIDSERGGQALDSNTIARLITEKVQPFLPVPTGNQSLSGGNMQSTTPAAYVTPHDLDATTADHYRQSIEQLYESYRVLQAALTRHNPQHAAVADLVLPVASSPLAKQLMAVATKEYESIHKLTDDVLPAGHADSSAASVYLVQSQPRNELDLAAQVAYLASDLPLRQLQALALDWSYQQKADLLHAGWPAVLDAAYYSWDVVADIASLLQIQQQCGKSSVLWQELTPRMGYEVPDVIEQAGLTEQFEACFDTSLALHSLLQQKSSVGQAQQAVLLGHKARASISCSAGQLRRLLQADTAPTTATTLSLAKSLATSLAENHPLIGQVLLV